ncbi:MAG: lactamase [Bacteroidota bacterium]|nr:lactamase [Bacteroidota bacterium]
MKFKKIATWVLGFIVLVFLIVGGFYFISVRPVMQKMMAIHTINYDKDLTLVIGGGGNSGILTSDSLVLVVDTKMGEAGEPFYKQVKQIAGNRPVIVVNTHVHGDHTSGNHFFKQDKGTLIYAGGNYDKEFWKSDAKEENMATDWVKDSLVIKVGDETVTILNIPYNAHTQSDLLIYLHNHKMIFTGDVVLNKQSPAMFKRYKASSAGYVDAFNLMERRFDIKYVVPGHGSNGSVAIIDDFRTFFEDMKAAAADPSKKNDVLSKYGDWTQVPFIMSPAAAISYIKGENEK